MRETVAEALERIFRESEKAFHGIPGDSTDIDKLRHPCSRSGKNRARAGSGVRIAGGCRDHASRRPDSETGAEITIGDRCLCLCSPNSEEHNQ